LCVDYDRPHIAWRFKKRGDKSMKTYSGAYFALVSLIGCGTVDDTLPPVPTESEASSVSISPVLSGWTASTSEEFAPIGCGAGSLISSMRCSVSNCDNVAAFCSPASAVLETFPGLRIFLKRVPTTAFAQQEAG
jgi:hypothetical protein